MDDKKDLIYSYYSIRKTIGVLGILLPFILVFVSSQLLPSISHYYYTKASVFFTSILASFGLLLISYKGYKKSNDEKFSDNLITHIAGFSVLIVVLVPTSCLNSNSLEICTLCQNNTSYLFGHHDKTKNLIHLISAAIFLFSMGWMSYFRFTKSNLQNNTINKIKRTQNTIYKTCAFIIWISLFLMILEFLLNKHITKNDIFILESFAILGFGFSWLVKGETLKALIDKFVN